jgi:hypothetical protein
MISKKILNILLTCSLFSIHACDQLGSDQQKANNSDTVSIGQSENIDPPQSIKFVDSFINANQTQILQNAALQEHYEALCTKQILPLIDKKDLYGDVPFTLVVTTLHNGTAYGNFVFNDEKYFIKVQCTINKSLLDSLEEKHTYFISFKTQKFEDGVSFKKDNSDPKKITGIDFPTVDAQLLSFKKTN